MKTETTALQEILLSAIAWQSEPSTHSKPSGIALSQSLQQTERTQKRTLPTDAYSQLLGTWRLVFVSKAKSPSGQWVPKWVQIQITYTQDTTPPFEPPTDRAAKIVGRVFNQVQLGLLKLILSGPTAFNPTNGILAFDFTQFAIELGKRSLFSGTMRGGTVREAEFYDLPLKQQAFFRFFWITTQGIAARGKGGGLALWAPKKTG